MSTLNSNRVLTRHQLAADKGIRASNPTLLRWESRNQFPRRFYLGPKTAAWWERDIDAWLIEQSQRGDRNTLTDAATESRRERTR